MYSYQYIHLILIINYTYQKLICPKGISRVSKIIRSNQSDNSSLKAMQVANGDIQNTTEGLLATYERISPNILKGKKLRIIF